MTVRELFTIDLKPGEEVVSATYYHDSIVVVTNRGTVYRIDRTEP